MTIIKCYADEDDDYNDTIIQAQEFSTFLIVKICGKQVIKKKRKWNIKY